MVCEKGGSSSGLEWRLTVSEGFSEELAPQTGKVERLWLFLMSLIIALKNRMWGFMEKIWKIGVDEPRRVIHSLKVALSLSVVSLFYYLRPLYDGVGGTSMWAVMTVVVVSEYTVGGTLSKGLNRGIATFTAGTLAVGVNLLARQVGDKAQPIVLSISVFFIASTATFCRFIPVIKKLFDYGVTIFILTFSFVSVSGFRVDEFLDLASHRLMTIVIGASMCIIVSMLVQPIWAGEELHVLIVRNMEKLASALDGCVAGYFLDDDDEGYEESIKKSKSYICVLNSKASEESYANFARWEPAHGQFGFRCPWKRYLNIGTALRYSACCVEALNASTNSDIKPPDLLKKHLSRPCMSLGAQSSNVLKELATSAKAMKKSSTIDFLVSEMNSGVEELRNAMKSFPAPSQFMSQASPTTAHEEAGQGKGQQKQQPMISTSVPLMELMPLVTVASLLIEIAARIEGVVSAVHELADSAHFKFGDGIKPIYKHPIEIDSEKQGQELASMKKNQAN